MTATSHSEKIEYIIKPGDHVCSIYQNRQQQFASIIPYIKEGLLNKQKCIYVYDDCSIPEILLEFQKNGFFLQKYITSKQLVFFTNRDTYLKGGTFDPKKVFDLIKELEALSSHEGYENIRATGEMTWSLDTNTKNDLIIEYESQLTNLLSDGKGTSFCQYNENRFGPYVLTEMLRTHPKAIMYGIMYNNSRFNTTPIDIASSDLVTESTYRRAVNEIMGTQ